MKVNVFPVLKQLCHHASLYRELVSMSQHVTTMSIGRSIPRNVITAYSTITPENAAKNASQETHAQQLRLKMFQAQLMTMLCYNGCVPVFLAMKTFDTVRSSVH